MKRSCPASARSTATRSSRATRCPRAITSCSTPKRSRASSSRAARRSTSSSSSTRTSIDADVFRQALLRRPRRRPRRGGLCRPARRAEGGEEGRRRPARDARPGICRRAEAVRPRAAARDAALRRRGQQVVGLLPRHRRPQARPRPARHGLDADRAQSRRVRPERVPQPLRRCAPSPDRGEAEDEGREDHRGSGRRCAAAQGLERHRPHGRAQEEPRRREEGQGRAKPKKAAKKASAKKEPAKAPARKRA